MNERSGLAWKEARYESITGSDVSKIMGCDDRISPRMLCYNKIYKIDPLDNPDHITKNLLYLGNQFEACALADFRKTFMERKFSYNGYVPGMSPHLLFSWFTGTPDYICDF